MPFTRTIFNTNLETATTLYTAVRMVNSCEAQGGEPDFIAYVETRMDGGNMDNVMVTLGYIASNAIPWDSFMQPIRDARSYLESRPGDPDETY